MTKENESHVMSRLFLEIASSTSDVSSIHTAGAITEEQHRAIAMIRQGKAAVYDGGTR